MRVRDTAAARASRAVFKPNSTTCEGVLDSASNCQRLNAEALAHYLHKPIGYSPKILLLLVPLRAPLHTLPSTT